MLDLNLQHDDDLLPPKLQSSSSSSSLSNPTFLLTPSHHQPLAAGLGGSSHFSMQSHPHVHESGKGLKFKIRKKEESREYETQNKNNSGQWMASKMISSDRSTVVDPPTPKLEYHNHQKTLCNACGIRQRKARRAMAAAANGTTLPAPMKNKRWSPSGAQATIFKKRCKIINSPSSAISSRKKICFEFSSGRQGSCNPTYGSILRHGSS